MNDSRPQSSDQFLSIPSHMKNRGWQLGMLFLLPAFVAAVIVIEFLPEWQVIAVLMISLFVPFAGRSLMLSIPPDEIVLDTEAD